MATDLNKLYSEQRTGSKSLPANNDIRTAFQRDYDRIIFSSAFRRLQNKTQVFPLPGSVFVHNRLTHSLEVSSVGRSLGTLAGDFIAGEYAPELSERSVGFYRYSLYNVIASACLCHDIGNPAFGHSGEDAIATYFIKNEPRLRSYFSDGEWNDFIHFEGNSNAIRILTQQQPGKSEGGLLLTYSTLMAIAKYPCESIARDKKRINRKKFGFLQSEKALFKEIALSTGMQIEQEDPLVFGRHPFVWLVEAADDICYNIMDLEDAHRLGIIDHKDCVSILCSLIEELDPRSRAHIAQRLGEITDRNGQVSYLRAKAIGSLVEAAMEVYKNCFQAIREGLHEKPLLDIVAERCPAIKEIETFSNKYIYEHHSVVEIENAGYNVLYELLHHFIPPVLEKPERRFKSDEKALKLLPSQFLYPNGTPYQQVLGILDYVSGMTDNYATDLYRKIKGIEIGMSL